MFLLTSFIFLTAFLDDIKDINAKSFCKLSSGFSRDPVPITVQTSYRFRR